MTAIFVRLTGSPVNEGPRYPDWSPDNEDLTARVNLEICGKFRKIVNLKLLVKYFTHTNGKPLILKLTL